MVKRGLSGDTLTPLPGQCGCVGKRPESGMARWFSG